MGKVYAPPAEIGDFEFDYANDIKNWQKAEAEYTNKIVEFAKKNGTGDLRGKVISFGVADGSAVYVVYSLKPVALIHVPTGDAWRFPYVNRLTASDIRKQVNTAAAWEQLFAQK